MLLPIIKQAADIVGGIPKLADALGIERQALYMWKAVPPKRVPGIVAATQGKITAHQLRPDLWAPEQGAA